MKTRIEFALTGSLLVLAAVLTITYRTSAQGPSDFSINKIDRVIVKRSDWDPPVKISKIKTRKGVIESNKPYKDDDDWLKGLTINLDNDSGKELTYISLDIFFRRPDNQADKPPGVWSLEYGEDPFRYTTGEPVPPIRVKPIKDGESFVITLSDHNFYRMIAFLDDIKYSVFNVIEVRVSVIGFSDGTAWTGQMMQRNPASPFGWSPVDPPQREPRSRSRTPSNNVNT